VRNTARISVLIAGILLFTICAEAQQTEAKVPLSPFRVEKSLSNSEQQSLANRDKYRFGTRLTRDLSPVAVPILE
jgi:uncharacterized lipoprotein YajG